MTTTPYELLARFATDGTIAGVSVRYLTTVNGKVYEGDPQPLANVDDPVFNDFADQFSAAVVAERDELAEQVESLTQAKQAAEASVAELTAQVATLQTELDAIQNPPGPDLSTANGVKQYLASKRYDREVMGFHVEQQLISTNRDELAHWFARFFDAFNHLQGVTSASGGVYPYKPRGGTQVALLTAEQAVRAYQCLAWYVNACIATEGQLIQQIDDGTLTLTNAVMAIDSDQTWPQRQFNWVA
jgi:hypothetical protein